MAVFVGRDDELRVLGSVAAAPLAGDVAAAVVVGDPGSGKSRLLAEARYGVRVPHEFEILGYEPESGVALAAASGLLRSLAAAPGGRVLEGLLFSAGPPAESPLEPLRVFEATHRALDRLGPTVVFVDDLQWVDAVSLALCHFLLRAAVASGGGLAIVAAGRPSEAVTSFATSLEHVLGVPRRYLELGPLSRDDALALTRALAPDLDKDAARELAERAAGSPFWVEVLARSGEAESDAARLVSARLRGASVDAGELLALLAVAGRPIAPVDAASIQGWEVARTAQAARELVARGILAETAGALGLVHDLLRPAALAAIPAERRRDLHRRLGEWLARAAEGDIARLREALGHFRSAGLPRLDLALDLARSPQRTLLGDEGLDLLVQIADDADAADPTVGELNREIASLAGALARPQVALARALLLAERATDALTRAWALLDASRAAFALDDSSRSSQASRGSAQRCGGRRAAGDRAGRPAGDARPMGRRPKRAGGSLAHGAARRAEALIVRDDSVRAAYLEALRVEYEAAYQEDDVEAMVRAAEERAAAAPGFDHEMHLSSTLALARALRRAGRIEEAIERAERAWEEAQRRVLPRLMLDAGYWLGTFLLVRGSVLEAVDIVEDATELAGRVGDEARGRHRLERLASEFEFHARDWRRGVGRLLEYAAAGAGEHGRVELHQLAALWLAQAGGEEVAGEVLENVERAFASAEAAGCPRCTTELRLAAADALAHVGRHDEARDSLAQWEAMQPRPQPRDEVVRARVKALVETPVSPVLLEAAVRSAEEYGFGLDALWIRVDLGSTLVASDRPQAKSVLIEAAELAATCGARTAQEARPETAARARGADMAARPCCSWADRTGAGGRAARGRRRQQPGDRAAALRIAEDRRAPCLERAPQGRGPEPGRARGEGRGARSRGSSPMIRGSHTA